MNSKHTVVIFGGCGYIGRKLSRYLLTHQRTTKVVLVDIREPSAPLQEGEVWLYGDVRESLLLSGLCELRPSWIFNFAAVHREPGHRFEEYFDTNIPGARNVCDYARHVECRRIFFTASIAIYGPTRVATSEEFPKYPSSGYGISKYLAEQIHEQWVAEEAERKLVICRPGVVYGPGDPGNILRMIRAIRKGLFVFPGRLDIYKSYAYIEGLLESMVFTMDHPDRLIRYNYVETPTEPLIDIARATQRFLGKRSPIIALPAWILKPVAHGVQWMTQGRSAIHPKRVEKAGTPTHIVPQWLMDRGFEFKYPFPCSLNHWQKESPLDFE
jgi:GlcNAc-P-P-Und epimerase